MKILFLLFTYTLIFCICILSIITLISVQNTASDSITLISPLAKAETKKEYLIYVSKKTGNYDIYRMDLLTKKEENLTMHPADDMNPQLSPDGVSLAFYSNRDKDTEIYMMNLRSKEIRQLTDNTANDYDPSYSPDGVSIVYKSTSDDQKGDIFMMNWNGTGLHNLTKNLSETEEWDPVFDNTGKKIYFVQRKNNDHLTDELFVMDIDGKNITQITKNTVPDWYPSIHPVNGAVLFVSKENKNSTDGIYTMQSDLSQRKKILELSGNSDDPAWDLTGSRIVFINAKTKKNYDIYNMLSNGNNVKKVIETQHEELSPIFVQSF